MKNAQFIVSAIACAAVAGTAAAQVELAVNGDFETGDLTGWSDFSSGLQSFGVTNDVNSGNFAGQFVNPDAGTAGTIKQANVGVGQVASGDLVTISFAAKANVGPGGVLFAEFFSELSGGGVSSAEILGGGPLAVTSDWQTFNFTAVAGPDVSGGVTLQFNGATGAFAGSTIEYFVDDVSIQIVPTPAVASLLGMGGLVAMRRRR
ncbi:MAG: hypothetical protein AAF356_10550 [Planctomycetota bacterium]